MSPVGIGASIGAVKGTLDQPSDSYLDPNTGLISKKTYNPGERLANIGTNAAIGAGLGYGVKALNLSDPKTLGGYLGNAKQFTSKYASGLEDKLGNVKSKLNEYGQVIQDKLPDVTITMPSARNIPEDVQEPLPQSIQDILNKKRGR